MYAFYYDYQEKVIPLEFKQGSVVIKGFPIKEGYIPKVLVFKRKHSRVLIDVIDALITPEIIILFTKQDPRNIQYRKCLLHLEKELSITTGNGLLEQIVSLDL
jgi:hypothetical protein